MAQPVSNLTQFKRLLADRVGQPLVIVERYGWREMGHKSDIYEAGTLSGFNRTDMWVNRRGQDFYLSFPPPAELKFPEGNRMEHWGKSRDGQDVILLAYEWPDQIDQARAEKYEQALKVTTADYQAQVDEANRVRRQRNEERQEVAKVERERQEAAAASWIDYHEPRMALRTAHAAPHSENFFLLNAAEKNGVEHLVLISRGPGAVTHLIDAHYSGREAHGQKMWQVTEWPLTPQSLRFRVQDIPGLDAWVNKPRDFQPPLFDIQAEASRAPELYGALPQAMAARQRVHASHKVLDVKVTRGKVSMVEVTHQGAFMAGPETVKFVPDKKLRGKSGDQMIAVLEAAKAQNILEFSRGRLFVSKDLVTDRFKTGPGMLPLVPDANAPASVNH